MDRQILGIVDILQVLRRRWRWFIGTVVLLTALALMLSLQQDKKYTASASVLLRTVADSSVLQADPNFQVPFFADRQVKNALQVIASTGMRASVEEKYDGPLESFGVTAEGDVDGSDAVTISATGTDPDEVAEFVNVYAQTYITYTQERLLDDLSSTSAQIQVRIDELDSDREAAAAPLAEVEAALASNPDNPSLLQQREALELRIGPELEALDNQRATFVATQQQLALTAGLASGNSAQILSQASPPTEPVSPNPVRDAIVGLMFGLGLGFALALIRDFLDETLRTSEDVERILAGRYPILGVIPEAEGGELELRADLAPGSPIAEAYRSLRTSVRFAELDRPNHVIQITSASAAEGKTTTAANLAKVLAQAGHQVAAACCDLRRPQLHHHFGAHASPGLADVILGECNLDQALQAWSPNLFVLAAGTTPPNPSELLGTVRAERLIMAMADGLDFVVLDSTPVLAVTDAIVESRFVDATIVVVRSGRTTRRQLREAFKVLEQAQAPVIGVVVNCATSEERNMYGYAYTDPGYYRAEGQALADERGTAPVAR